MTEERNNNIIDGDENASVPENESVISNEKATEELNDDTSPVVEAPESAEEAPKAQYVYHWDGDESVAAEKSKKKPNGVLTFGIIMAIAFGIALAALLAVIIFLPSTNIGSETAYPIEQLVEKCSPFTVAIETTSYTTNGSTSMSVGSGFILTENGYMSNDKDMAATVDQAAVTKKAKLLAQGIADYFLDITP